MQEVFKAIERLARSDLSALILGEPGTGKKLVAHSIHQKSRRQGRLILTLDCTQPREQLNAQLFGGPAPRISRLPLVAGGTLLLHHVDAMTLQTQTKVLELLETQRTIANQSGEPEIRILASADNSLSQAVAVRAFREDLFHLLGSIQVELPPLRQRMQDLPLLTCYFLQSLAVKRGRPAKALSRTAASALARYRWPENVRELEGVIERAESFSTGPVIEFGDLPAELLTAIGSTLFEGSSMDNGGLPVISHETPDFLSLSRRLFVWARAHTEHPLIPAMERELIVQALVETQGNQVHAAKLLGISRATLRKRLHRFNIKRDVYIH